MPYSDTDKELLAGLAGDQFVIKREATTSEAAQALCRYMQRVFNRDIPDVIWSIEEPYGFLLRYGEEHGLRASRWWYQQGHLTGADIMGDITGDPDSFVEQPDPSYLVLARACKKAIDPTQFAEVEEPDPEMSKSDVADRIAEALTSGRWHWYHTSPGSPADPAGTPDFIGLNKGGSLQIVECEGFLAQPKFHGREDWSDWFNLIWRSGHAAIAHPGNLIPVTRRLAAGRPVITTGPIDKDDLLFSPDSEDS